MYEGISFSDYTLRAIDTDGYLTKFWWADIANQKIFYGNITNLCIMLMRYAILHVCEQR